MKCNISLYTLHFPIFIISKNPALRIITLKTPLYSYYNSV